MRYSVRRGLRFNYHTFRQSSYGLYWYLIQMRLDAWIKFNYIDCIFPDADYVFHAQIFLTQLYTATSIASTAISFQI